MNYPEASYPAKVGSYPAITFSGGGYVYDDVLEYRVWEHPVNKPARFEAFANYNEALLYSNSNKHAEKPLVLVLQKEYIDEKKPGKFILKQGPRLTEWLVEWLVDSKRTQEKIEEILSQK
jgi:hypothetical protein